MLMPYKKKLHPSANPNRAARNGFRRSRGTIGKREPQTILKTDGHHLELGRAGQFNSRIKRLVGQERALGAEPTCRRGATGGGTAPTYLPDDWTACNGGDTATEKALRPS